MICNVLVDDSVNLIFSFPINDSYKSNNNDCDLLNNILTGLFINFSRYILSLFAISSDV